MQLRPLRSLSGKQTDEDMVLAILRQTGPQTLDDLSSTTGLDWGQTFSVIDRLSRSGSVALHRGSRCEYHVSLGQMEQQAFPPPIPHVFESASHSVPFNRK